jgi:hypothetical protein
MIPKNSMVRVARPTDSLEKIVQMNIDGLEFRLVSGFKPVKSQEKYSRRWRL